MVYFFAGPGVIANPCVRIGKNLLGRAGWALPSLPF